MPRDYQLYFDDICRACEKILSYTKSLSREQFFEDAKTLDAVLENIDTVGQAARHIPEWLRTQYGDTPWRKIAGFRVFFEDIIGACERIRGYTQGLSREAFFADGRTLDAVLRNLENIGRAVRHVPVWVKNKYAEIPWRKIEGFGDVAKHACFALDHDVIWDIVSREVAPLQESLKQLKV